MESAQLAPNVYKFATKDIEGKPVKLDKFKGKVLLVVNVASQCGLTPQYKGLQAIYSKYKDQGLVIVGFPANDFGNQEPGSEGEIKTFCETSYGVTFPMMEKTIVKGENKSPLFAWLIEKSGRHDEIEWNLPKFHSISSWRP
ncbi:glutathione peroxidase, partial [bacterium]